MEIYLVGGAVRDELLGEPVKDRDWVVTGATPAEMLTQGYKQVGADFPVFLHPKTREEYALARTERKQGRGYHGFTVYSAPDVTLEDDLLRRDLTINAMAKSQDGALVDPFHGQRDIDARLLRHVSDAFAEDPLRILRTARFAARFSPKGFQVADDTMALMKTMVADGEVADLVPERIWQEMQRALMEQSPTTFFSVLRDCGALATLIPELDESQRFSTAMAVLDCTHHKDLPLESRLAALLSPLEPEASNQRAISLKAPNDCIALARLVSALAPKVQQNSATDSETTLSILDEADAWRRPDRFSLLMSTLACVLPASDQHKIDHSQQAFSAARSVNAKSLMAKGYQGKELGEAIRNERLQRISSLQTAN